MGGNGRCAARQLDFELDAGADLDQSFSLRLERHAAASHRDIELDLFRGRHDALPAYERTMQRRFLAKDAVSWLVQGFLGQPVLFEYAARRVAARSAVRATMGLVMGDLVPAGRALDPRFLVSLLAP